ncbi:MAG: phytoene/squalene synthase family protein [Pseudomonadota bacterium]
MANGDVAYAKASIAKGSQSFAAASRLLPADVRDDVVRLYAWCRHADDVIDGQDHGHGVHAADDPAAALADLRAKTDAVLSGTVLGEPVFDGLGVVARARGLTPRLCHDLLDGFQMDVTGRQYRTEDDLAEYCYGVAGAVGVMMALTIGVEPEDTDTLDRACDLGLAFQMTNIARDVIADALTGRVYLPAEWLAAEGLPATPEAVAAPQNADAVFAASDRLVGAAERYYASAQVGMARLPFRIAWAIAAAASVYREIGVRRRSAGPAGLPTRVSTGTASKLRLIGRSGVWAARRVAPERALSREGLWTRPPRP